MCWGGGDLMHHRVSQGSVVVDVVVVVKIVLALVLVAVADFLQLGVVAMVMVGAAPSPNASPHPHSAPTLLSPRYPGHVQAPTTTVALLPLHLAHPGQGVHRGVGGARGGGGAAAGRGGLPAGAVGQGAAPHAPGLMMEGWWW